MSKSNNMIEIKNLNFKYHDNKEMTLKDINLTVKSNQWVSIIGQNGSGKSTLIRLIIGLLNAKDKNSIQIMGSDLSDSNLKLIRRNMGVIFQNPEDQFVGSTVAEDVAFGLENRGVPREKMIPIIEKSLKQVDMFDYYHHSPHHLSDGQKQRVALAGVLAIKPQIIILDEATSMLDPVGKNELIQLVKELKQKYNLTVLSVTHDMNEAKLADQLFVMNKGSIIKSGSPNEIFTEDKLLTEVGLDLPLTKKVQNYINELGYDLPMDELLNEEELVDKLWQLNFKK